MTIQISKELFIALLVSGIAALLGYTIIAIAKKSTLVSKKVVGTAHIVIGLLGLIISNIFVRDAIEKWLFYTGLIIFSLIMFAGFVYIVSYFLIGDSK